MQFHAQSRLIFKSNATSITSGQWHQVVMRRRGNLFQLFLDGAVVASGKSSASIPTTTMPLLIGKRNEFDGRGFPVKGRIDEVALWRGALGDEQIAYLYNRGNGNPVIRPSIRSPK